MAHAGSPGGSGGGSEVCGTGKLVEAFGGEHTVHDLPGFDLAVQKMNRLVPKWTSEQESNLEKKNLYVLPCKFEQIPPNITDLFFGSENPCYQTEEEMFCEDRILRESPTKWKNFFTHELVISAYLKNPFIYTPPTIADVRSASGVLIQDNLTYLKAAKVLREHNLGTDSKLLPAEYFQSLGKPQGTVSLPSWATPRSNLLCAPYGQHEASELGLVYSIFVPKVPEFTHPIAIGANLAVYNGFLYLAEFGPVKNEDRSVRSDLRALKLSRDLSSDQLRTSSGSDGETLIFICPTL